MHSCPGLHVCVPHVVVAPPGASPPLGVGFSVDVPPGSGFVPPSPPASVAPLGLHHTHCDSTQPHDASGGSFTFSTSHVVMTPSSAVHTSLLHPPVLHDA